MTTRWLGLLAAAGLVVCRAPRDRANPADDDAALRRAMADSGGWPSYGRDYTNQRYSPLSQINPATIGGLRLAWQYATGIRQAFEASPIVLGNVMYVSTPLNHIVALDASTGKKLWGHSETLGTTIHCCGPVNHGVAVYGRRVGEPWPGGHRTHLDLVPAAALTDTTRDGR